MLIFALFFLALLGFLIYGFARLLQVTPRYTGQVQGFFARLSGWTRTRQWMKTSPLGPAGRGSAQIRI